MSILIKGMELPKEFDPDVYVELACGIDGKRYARLYNFHQGGLTEWCEAVPVPPHGRLIDADALLKDGADYEYPLFDTDGSWDCCTQCFDVDSIKNAPTIIPAEEVEA